MAHVRQHKILPVPKPTALFRVGGVALPPFGSRRSGDFMRRQCAWAGIGILSFVIALTSSPALSQFVCTTTPSDINCTNSGTAPTAFTNDAGGANQNATTTNSGIANRFTSQTDGGGNATATNTGSDTGGVVAQTSAGGNATATNSGTNTGSIAVLALAGGNATVINSGTSGPIVLEANSGNAAVTNSGIINGLGFPAIQFLTGRATLTDIVGGLVIGTIDLAGGRNAVNFVGGNWLFTFNTLAGATANAAGAPFVVSGNQVAVLDPTTFALADRSLTNFTGEISQMLQGRFGGITAGGGGAGALGFAPASHHQSRIK